MGTLKKVYTEHTQSNVNSISIVYQISRDQSSSQSSSYSFIRVTTSLPEKNNKFKKSCRRKESPSDVSVSAMPVKCQPKESQKLQVEPFSGQHRVELESFTIGYFY